MPIGVCPRTINGRNNQEAYRVFSFSEQEGFQDLEDFDPTLALTDRLNDDRHLQTAAIHTAGFSIPPSSGLSSWTWESESATSWELRMDITVTQHSANGTFFKTVGWQPGGYSGIQQKPDTNIAKSGKNFIFSMNERTVPRPLLSEESRGRPAGLGLH